MTTNPRTSQTTPSAAAPGRTEPAAKRDHPDQSRHHGGPSGAGTPGSPPALAPSPSHQTVPCTAALRPLPGQGLPPGRVDAGGTRLRLRALHVMGHGSVRIARALGVRQTTIQQLVRGDATTISPKLRDAVSDLYDAWWDKRAPERTRAERAAATAARKRAIADNWCAAAALDDDQLDTPGYRPRYGWKPATGTGVAPDRPLSRPRRSKGA